MWYTAGSNTVVYSNPKAETGGHGAQRPDLEPPLARGRVPPAAFGDTGALGDPREGRVRAAQTSRCSPASRWPEQAWSEYQYKAYSYVMPKVVAGRCGR